MTEVSVDAAYSFGIRIEESSIWIYGKGGTGIRTDRMLMEAGCTVCGFIDKRAHEMIGGSIPVVTLAEAAQEIQDKQRVVVIVCLKDVFQHEALARDLLAAGFHQIIYKPAHSLNGKDDNSVTQYINEIYERIVEKGQPPLANCMVPWTKCIPIRLVDKFLIEDCGETILAWVPVELVFNYVDGSDYPGCNMPLLFGLVDLYRAFLGELSAEEEYETAIQDFYLYCGEWLHKNGLSIEEKPLVGFLDSRAGVFQHLEKLAEINMGFFQQHAPAASYMDGKFYLVSSGRNRVSFQIAKGARHVSLRLTKADYVAWCDLPMVRAAERKLSESDKSCRFAPAAHPYLVNLSCEFADYMRLFVLPAAKEIVKKLYLQCVVTDGRGIRHVDFVQFETRKRLLRIFENMDDGGVLRNYFQSLGFVVVSGSDWNPSEEAVCFWSDPKTCPIGYGYCLCKDGLPDWFSLNKGNGDGLMFVAKGLKHRYLGIRV